MKTIYTNHNGFAQAYKIDDFFKVVKNQFGEHAYQSLMRRYGMVNDYKLKAKFFGIVTYNKMRDIEIPIGAHLGVFDIRLGGIGQGMFKSGSFLPRIDNAFEHDYTWHWSKRSNALVRTKITVFGRTFDLKYGAWELATFFVANNSKIGPQLFDFVIKKESETEVSTNLIDDVKARRYIIGTIRNGSLSVASTPRAHDEEGARAEAARLAAKEPGVTFVVLHYVKGMAASQIVEF